MCAASVPTQESTQTPLLSIRLISLCQINICGERREEVRTKSIRKAISCLDKAAEASQKFAKDNLKKS